MKEINLYFHIPYCKAKCRFCSFYVIPGRTTKLNDYFECLKKEIDLYKELLNEYSIKTIYIGGGTPSLVEDSYLTTTLDYIHKRFNVDSSCEVSVEVNPETISKQKITNYLKAGVNRFSIGLQSTDDTTLKFLGRLYTFNEFKSKYNIIKELSIENINLDLIFGIPSQTIKEWEQTLNETIQLTPSHISTYSLEIDEDSIFSYLEKKGRFKRMDEIEDRKMYKITKEILKQHNYMQYEISNFSKQGYSCRHNTNIWKGEDYLGFGASAHGRIKSLRYMNVNSIERYINNINLGIDVREEIITLSKKDLINEYLILNLRTNTGINTRYINQRFLLKFENEYKESIIKLKKQKLISINNEFISLTNKGQDLENIVNLELLR